jgi:predicted transcriptional regulator
MQDPDGPTTQIAIRVPNELLQRLDWACNCVDRSRAYIICRALEDFLPAFEKENRIPKRPE